MLSKAPSPFLNSFIFSSLKPTNYLSLSHLCRTMISHSMCSEQFLDAMDNPQTSLSNDLKSSRVVVVLQPMVTTALQSGVVGDTIYCFFSGKKLDYHMSIMHPYRSQNCWKFTITANSPNVNLTRSPIPQQHPNMWLMDLGAIHSVIHDLNGLSLHSKYDSFSTNRTYWIGAWGRVWLKVNVTTDAIIYILHHTSRQILVLVAFALAFEHGTPHLVSPPEILALLLFRNLNTFN